MLECVTHTSTVGWGIRPGTATKPEGGARARSPGASPPLREAVAASVHRRGICPISRLCASLSRSIIGTSFLSAHFTNREQHPPTQHPAPLLAEHRAQNKTTMVDPSPASSGDAQQSQPPGGPVPECPFCVMMRKGGCEETFKVRPAGGLLRRKKSPEKTAAADPCAPPLLAHPLDTTRPPALRAKTT